MRRMNPIGLNGVLIGGIAALGLAAAPALAVQADFHSSGIGFISSTELSALPSATIDLDVPLLSAGDSGGGDSFEVDFTGSSDGDICILVSSSPSVCQADLSSVTTAYSAIVTLEISALNTDQITGPFTLVLSMLETSAASGDIYRADEVSIALDPTVPLGLNTSAVPGFNFDGSFSSMVRIEDLGCSNSDGYCNYLGWTVTGISDTVTFRFDISTAPDGRDTPILLFNAVPIVVPEPGTALLMALGLTGLSFGGRRRRYDGAHDTRNVVATCNIYNT